MKSQSRKPTGERPINDRQRRFCELLVGGHPAGRAYELAGYAARGDVADVMASRMMRIDRVSAHIAALREAAAKSTEFTRHDLVGFLVEVIKTPVGDVGPNNRLAQEVTRDEIGEMVVRTKVKMPAKLDAAKQLCAMLGWNAPEKVEVDAADKLVSLLQRIRTR